ncbi:unnamed protein product [Anisakis simplex]|uniref:Glycosyl transferase n=1 Tax=Anisakis simplex TaxID=6269 RepID=A0A0M3IZT2_ANISI|nr:unnamed protein product [Anisakis simplex]
MPLDEIRQRDRVDRGQWIAEEQLGSEFVKFDWPLNQFGRNLAVEGTRFKDWWIVLNIDGPIAGEQEDVIR